VKGRVAIEFKFQLVTSLIEKGRWLLATGYWLGLGPNIVYSSFASGEHSGLLRGITKAKQRLSFFLVFWLDNDLSVLANCTSHLSLSLSLSLHLSSETGILSFLFCRKKKILNTKIKKLLILCQIFNGWACGSKRFTSCFDLLSLN